MIVPSGHSHTPLQTLEQNLKSNLLAQVVAHSGFSPQSLKTCPLTVQFATQLKNNCVN